jgi:hypothetical protein
MIFFSFAIVGTFLDGEITKLLFVRNSSYMGDRTLDYDNFSGSFGVGSFLQDATPK